MSRGPWQSGQALRAASAAPPVTAGSKVNAGAAATSVRIRASPARRRPDVVTREGNAAPAALQVEYRCPDHQRDDWDENDHQNDHHDLFSGGVLSVLPPIGSESLSINFVQQQYAATTPYGTGYMGPAKTPNLRR